MRVSACQGCTLRTCCHPRGRRAQVVLYKVVPIGTSPADVTLQMLGFYDVTHPQLLSFSPKDFSAIERSRPCECKGGPASTRPLPARLDP